MKMKKVLLSISIVIFATILLYPPFINFANAYDPNAVIGGAINFENQTMSEGATTNLHSLWLNPSPDAPTTSGSVTIYAATPTVCIVGATTASFGDSYTVNFTNTAGNAYFNLAIKATDDNLVDGSGYCQVYASVNVNGSYYQGFTNIPIISMVVYDDDGPVSAYMDRTAGWSVDESTAATENSALDGDAFVVVISGTAPQQISITATTDGQCQFVNAARTAYIGTIKSYVVGPYNWDFGNSYPFILGPVDDSVDEAEYHYCNVTTHIYSEDSRWSSIQFPIFKMGIIDNDGPVATQKSGKTSATPISQPTTGNAAAAAPTTDAEPKKTTPQASKNQSKQTTSATAKSDADSGLTEQESPSALKPILAGVGISILAVMGGFTIFVFRFGGLGKLRRLMRKLHRQKH